MTESFDTFAFEDADVGVRFEIDARFAAGPRVEPAVTTAQAGAPRPIAEVRTAYLTAALGADRHPVLSVSAVAVEYEMTREKLQGDLALHNERGAQIAAEKGWTLIRPWELAELGGSLAMRCEYVVPPPARLREHGEEGELELPVTPLHLQSWIAYVGRWTYQVVLSSDSDRHLDNDRALMETVTRTFEFIAAAPAAGA